ncbi:MAG TPA: CoA-acylating methylmalonate-semialdehyde dehydrogenase [Bacteroidales bacterium]|jgi:malonate-semialdehyde dehydrogenase (acetylating)/methylmalonate-semialdehyde dehydrogenase|nr:CoA-acylating methylmalonate-semialdehyde dehydrogenase [Bacteroidales bacterium]
MALKIKNYINGQWVESKGAKYLDVINPATSKCESRVPAGSREDVDYASESAHRAWYSWKNTPAVKRVQYLFRMKQILEDNVDEIASICTRESGKTFAESKAEMVRAVENIEVACNIPKLMQSDFSENIATGIDEFYIRQSLGVGACIAPFNFPIMIPFWFMPYAIACGNTYIVKPSEKVPLTMTRIFELFEAVNLPAGVLNMVHGGKETVDSILENKLIPAISFVGSTPVAKYIYQTGTSHGKRIQAQGGAKNPVVVMPDADEDTAVRIIADSAFGCAGQRCLAASIVITVGSTGKEFADKIVKAAKAKKVGNGFDEGVDMGPVITAESKQRIERVIEKGLNDGGRLLLDGRDIKVPGHETGYFIGPTIIELANTKNEIYDTEIFGPVLCLVHVDSLDKAIELVNTSKYGNSACIFTRSGNAARKFRNEVLAGNVGINIGIAAPMAFFPFSGWKESFFGDLHGQSMHAIEFYTQTKVVIERWHDEWARKF